MSLISDPQCQPVTSYAGVFHPGSFATAVVMVSDELVARTEKKLGGANLSPQYFRRVFEELVVELRPAARKFEINDIVGEYSHARLAWVVRVQYKVLDHPVEPWTPLNPERATRARIEGSWSKRSIDCLSGSRTEYQTRNGNGA